MTPILLGFRSPTTLAFRPSPIARARRPAAFVGAAAFALLASAAIVDAQAPPSSGSGFKPEILYEAGPDVAGSMSVDEARAALTDWFRSQGWREIQFTKQHLSAFKKGASEPATLRFAEIAQARVIKDDRGIGATYALLTKPVDDYLECGCMLTYAGRERHVPALRRLADALLVLRAKSSVTLDPDYQVRFDQEAEAYRRAVVKPLVPEDARRALVQGTALINQGDFAGAAEVYEAAVELTPWWADGHFNLAYVLSSLGQYPSAIVAMRRFLTLAPESPDARRAQDLIYEWELEKAP